MSTAVDVLAEDSCASTVARTPCDHPANGLLKMLLWNASPAVGPPMIFKARTNEACPVRILVRSFFCSRTEGPIWARRALSDLEGPEQKGTDQDLEWIGFISLSVAHHAEGEEEEAQQHERPGHLNVVKNRALSRGDTHPKTCR